MFYNDATQVSQLSSGKVLLGSYFHKGNEVTCMEIQMWDI